MLNGWTALIAEAQGISDLTAYGGWAGLGLTGTILGWLLGVHLPALGKQFTKLFDQQSEELKNQRLTWEADRKADRAAWEMERKAQIDQRAKDETLNREMRHQHASMYQASMADILKIHKEDAEKDRLSFEHRSDKMVVALEKQTIELKMELSRAIGTACKWQPQTHVPIRVPRTGLKPREEAEGGQ